MDVVNILGPRKALKRSKPMPDFGVPCNRPCSAGALLKRTSGLVNIPKQMSLNSSTASKLESDMKGTCIKLFCNNSPTIVMYPVGLTTGKSTGPEDTKGTNSITSTKSGIAIKASAASIGSLQSEGHGGSDDKLKLVPPRKVESKINSVGSINSNFTANNTSLPTIPQSYQSISTQRTETMSLIKSKKNPTPSTYAEKRNPVADSNAGGDSAMQMLPSMSALETGKTDGKKSSRRQPDSPQKSDSSASTEDSHSETAKNNPNKNEDTECKEPQMIMANNGAIRFQLPGRVQHKTTIKLAHYPEKSGETVVINVPEGDTESYCEEECENTPGQFRPNANVGPLALPPLPVGNNNQGNDFPMNGPNSYQPQFYNPGNSINGQNFYYSQQQQYMQPNPQNFQQQFGYMNDMNGGQNGFNNNSYNPFNYYSGPPPQPPPQNYQPYGYGYPI